MPFDPDKYLAAKSGFDPDAYLASKGAPVDGAGGDGVISTPTVGDAALRGAAQGLTLGFADELGGAGGALADKLKGSDQSLLDLYLKNRDAQRAKDKAAHDAHPYISTGANIAGTIPTMLLGGGLPGLAKLSIPLRAAIEAGVIGAGNSEADLTKGEVGKFAGDVGRSAGTGALVGAAGEAAAPYLQKAADKFVPAALGMRKRALQEMIGRDKLGDFSRAVTESGDIKPLATVNDTYNRLAAHSDKLGQQIEQAIEVSGDTPAVEMNSLGSALKNRVAEDTQYLPEGPAVQNRFGKYFDEQLASKATDVTTPERELALKAQAADQAKLLEQAKQAQETAKQAAQEAENARAGVDLRTPNQVPAPALEVPTSDVSVPPPDKQLNLLQTWKMRRGIDQGVTDFSKSLTDQAPMQRALVQTRNKLQNSIQGSLPEEAQGLAGDYHNITAARDFALDAVARKAANNKITPTDYLAGGAGFAHGGTPEGLLLGTANHLIKARGASTANWGLNNLSKILSEQPQAFGKYATPLINAAKRGSQSLAVTHYLLGTQSPEYRQQIDSLGNHQ